MQTETPLYVTDVLGEIDNSETVAVEPQVRQGTPSRGPALFIADRRAAAKRNSEHGNFFEWLALGVLAAVIVALLATSGIGDTIKSGATDVISRITGAGKDSGNTGKDAHGCDTNTQKWDAGQNKCVKK